MRLTLDWDTDELKEMHKPAVRDRMPARESQRRVEDYVGKEPDTGKWELWRSSGNSHGEDSGWHYIEYDLGGDLETMRQLRTAYGDDALRTSLDGKRMEWGSPFVTVLYHLKNIKPGEHKPYATDKRAFLETREWTGDSVENIKNDDGTLKYPKIATLLIEHPDFGDRAALWRKILGRKSVTEVTWNRDNPDYPTQRGYDVINRRREPTRGEQKALRDYAESRDLGHYGEGGRPDDLDEKPTRSTFHEYWEMPEIEMDTEDFGAEDSDSEWYPVNIRTGRYNGDDEMSLKRAHDNVASTIVDELSPGFWQEHENDDGERTEVYRGLDMSRWSRAISLERDRPLDADEMARYRRIYFENQPGTGTDKQAVRDRLDRHGLGDPFGDDSIMWEVIVYDGDDALESGGSTDYWWIARGVLDGSNPDHVRNPVANSAIITDTMGFL